MNANQRIQQLTNAMLNETATDSDAAELSALLRDDRQAQSDYLHYVDTHAALCWEFRDENAAKGHSPVVPAHTTNGRSVAARTWLPWTIAVIASSVAVMALLLPDRSGDSPASTHSTVSSTHTNGSQDSDSLNKFQPLKRQPVVALLVDQAGAIFADGQSPDGVRFDRGRYQLSAGVVHLRFTNGADLVIQAPAEFRIDDDLHMRLSAGRVRGVVPPAAVGFTIATTAMDFEDVGTEFAVNVDSAGEAAMHVFNGQVNVRRSGDKGLLRSVFGGQWVNVRDGELSEGPALDLSAFQTPGHIGFQRWKNQRRQRLKDSGLIAWFPFISEANPSRLTNAIRSHGVPDGRIAGARWVSGRWAGKEALLFDGKSDFVQLQIPGEHQELSIAVWLRADGFDHEMNAILNSNEGEHGDVHFQVSRLGLPRGGVLGPEREIYRWVGNPIPKVKWTHVVSVISVLPQRTHGIYVNGELVTESKLADPGEAMIRPGYCRLGNWLPVATKPNQPSRAFRGMMDELTVWNRALSKAEIEELVDRGRPSLLWSRENPPLGMPLPKLW